MRITCPTSIPRSSFVASGTHPWTRGTASSPRRSFHHCADRARRSVISNSAKERNSRHGHGGRSRLGDVGLSLLDFEEEVPLHSRLRALQRALKEAVDVEDYELAAELRDRVKELQRTDPIVSLQEELELAVQEERYGDAAWLRDQIRELQPPAPPTSSCTVTDGIKVEVESFYFSQKSQPEANKFIFLYRIKVTNESHPGKVKLMAREWNVADDAGEKWTVRGPGAAGEQPELKPGQSFQYASVCPLRTPNGSMHGHYEFYGERDGKYMRSFLVYIGKFDLRADGPVVS